MYKIITFLCVLLAVAVSNKQSPPSHLLANIVTQLQNTYSSFHHTSDLSTAFSRLMKVKLELVQLRQSLGLPEVAPPKSSKKDCTALLKSLMQAEPNHDAFLHNFELFEKSLTELAYTCTNSDYPLTGSSLQQYNSENGFNDHCALCVVITRTMDNYIQYNKANVSEFVLKRFCELFDNTMLKPTCEAFIHYAGPTLIDAFYKREPADVVCIKLGYCKDPSCRIIGDISAGQNLASLQAFKAVKPSVIPSWAWIKHIFVDNFGDKHLPPFDLDNDTFSDVSTFRGYHWRGADCDEFNKEIYPGRKIGNHLIDHDCNGIFGRSTLHQKTFQELYCNGSDGSKRFGVAVIGDSAGAHFSIPEKFFNASMIHKGVYNDFLPRVADELDIPHESGYTGHTQTDDYLSHSVFKYVREWNLCNNNDYQNVGVNGGKAGNSEGNIKAIKRDPKTDYPLLMFMELIGNDVCSKSFDGMTKPQEFKQKLLVLLRWLDNNVPKGSHLFFFGLADGRILYDNLHDDIHPLNITYSNLYEFLNCLKISPCWGWLNSNETVRNYTSERAANLSKVYQQIIDEYTFENFDMVYYDFPTMEILTRRVMEGGDPKAMIERLDGFHPSVMFNSYLADWVWDKLKNHHKEWIGEPNSMNQDIRKRFKMKFFVDPKKPTKTLIEE